MSPTSVPHHPHALGQLSHGVDQADRHKGASCWLGTHTLVQPKAVLTSVRDPSRRNVVATR